ncbi:protein-L-isoaspartate O-methyltransferase family protein [Pararoseomonas indoligenes]|uniref:Protein-L-isoaspartate O-methyltransferase n=1 Tax=Roseomonas indoligenes TaxID=2820811 RepID=A0A940N032_9PROT|nr:protein-L-isoaspartate O-methyltransferase [Pararoseomonas indoligenes]MBP0492815.1 protein-L-isoaspartate O-methyltransferase [Pararoseomonas indoligenes]
MDFAEARRRMVDGQVKPNRVTDPRIFLAMQEIPRELFAPEALRVRSLSDEDLPLGQGRAMMQPLSLSRLLQLAAPRVGERVLVPAAGTGYAAAVLAHMGAQVIAVEEDAGLAALGAAAIAASGLPPGSLRQESGAAAAGFPAGGPYDLIFLEGGVPAVPPSLVEQLTEGGRVVTIRMAPGETGSAIVGRRAGAALRIEEAFDLRGTAIPAFAPKLGFMLA